jgi:hypothetical protein
VAHGGDGGPEPTTLRLWLNGAPFGAWRFSDWALLDGQGEEVGRAERPAPFSLEGATAFWEGRWYEVVLGERTAGRVRTQRGLKEGGLLALTKKLPVVEPATLPLDQEAERWLLALALAERLLAENRWQVGPFEGSFRRPGTLG